MPPKIEEIIDSPKPKNPFVGADKKKTVRRDAKEIYGDVRKGLNKPQYSRGTPLDKLFLELEQKLEGSIDEFTLDSLSSVLEISEPDAFCKRYEVVSKLFDYLLSIQDLASKENHIDKNLISISLHDIKTFSKLVNLIIIHGVYPPLNTFKTGIPLGRRRLNEFSKAQKPIKIDTIPHNSSAKTYKERFEHEDKLLTLMYSKFKIFFEKEGDVRDLLIKGTGYSDFLTISITLITCPYLPKEDKEKYIQEFDLFVIQLPGTYELFQTYSLYLSTQSPPYFKLFVMKKLQKLHYDAPKKDGLLTLVEFVLGLRENEEINVEKFDHVANVVLAKPKEVPTVAYFNNIGNQIYELLVNINRPNVTSCIGHVLERLWMKNKLVAHDFFLKRLWSDLNPESSREDTNGVIVTEKDFNNAINVLISLTKKAPSPEFAQYLFEPLLLPLWSYYVFLDKNKKSTGIIQNVLVGYFVSASHHEDMNNDLYGLDSITKNVIYSNESWEFMLGPNDLPQIVKRSLNLGDNKEKQLTQFFSDLDVACASFINLLKNLEDPFVLKVFKKLLKRWLYNNDDNLDEENPFVVLIDLRLIESIGNEFKENIAKTPVEILDIVEDFLSIKKSVAPQLESKLKITEDSDDSDDEEEAEADLNTQAMPVLFELLSAVLTEVSETDITSECKDKLRNINEKLAELLRSEDPLISKNQAAIKALKTRITRLLSGDKPAASLRDSHQKILERAITSLNDPLVPIRAHGLYLLRELIEAKSDIISLDFAVNLHLIQLKDPEPFIYLNVIKGLESLIQLNEKEVLKLLADIYANVDGKQDIDDRLRIGEVFLRYIQSSNELLQGESCDLLVNTSISMVRRQLDVKDEQDTRIRMSAMSLLGSCCRVNPLGMSAHLSDSLDCAIGILQLEKDTDLAVMRRAAIVLIHDLIIGTSNTESLPFPDEYRGKVVDTLRYISETDNDLLTREQAVKVLDDIDELVHLAYEAASETL